MVQAFQTGWLQSRRMARAEKLSGDRRDALSWPPG
jgi:hypothetical protein